MKAITVAAIALGLVVMSVRWNSFVAGGSDSYCYANQAERWAAVLRSPLQASLQPADPLALAAPWPDGAAAFVPTGHIASPVVRGASVPICAAGLAMAMAPAVVVAGPAAMFFVLPMFAALLVLATHAVGSRFGARVGVAAALLVAASPIVLYQVVQPMSDVPAAALWTAALAAATGTKRRSPLLAGLATSAAILVRPNLVPIGIALGVFLLLRPERTWRERLRAGAIYAAASAVGCFATALVQYSLYGSPLSSGYGAADMLFSWSHLMPNLHRYGAWLWQSHAVLVLLAAAAPFLLPGALVALLVAIVLINASLYLPYLVFEDWSFLRFLLPSIPVLAILAAAAADATWRRLAFVARAPALAARAWMFVAAVSVAIAALSVREARAHNAFRLQAMESRFATAGRFVARRLPQNALIVTAYESGSVRFYSGRPTIVWEALDASTLDAALAFARERGYEPLLLFERWEEPAFRARFTGHPLGALDWPPYAEIATQVRIYRPDDRDRYLRGESIPTVFER